MYSRAYLRREQGSESRAVAITFAASLVGHLIIFLVLVLAPSHLPARKHIPRVVDVSLVSLPSPAPPSKPKSPAGGPKRTEKKAPGKIKAPPVVPKKTATPKPEPKKSVSVAPRNWKEKTSLKKKTFKPDKVVKRAIERIEKKAEESRPESVAAAIDRLKKEVGDTPAPERKTNADGGGEKTDTAMDSGFAGGGIGTVKLTSEILLYQQQISYHIRNNWVFRKELAGKRDDLEAWLLIKILEDGTIKEVRFKKKSGNRYLDESASKAVMKSNPLPALPKGYQSYEIGLIFTPTGLQ